MENISGIYQIQSKCKPERIYIGSAVNIKNRWFLHLHLLRKNKHHSKKLQSHYNKYGEPDLQFSVLLGCEKEELIKNEQFFIDSYNPWFNCCPVAGNTLGIKYSEESKKRMSEGLIGNTRSKGKKRKPLSEEHKKKISEANKGKITGLGRKASPEARRNMSIARLGKKKRRGSQNYQLVAAAQRVPVLQYDLEMNFIKEWACAGDVKRELGFDRSAISACANNRGNTAYGFIWKHIGWELNIN